MAQYDTRFPIQVSEKREGEFMYSILFGATRCSPVSTKDESWATTDVRITREPRKRYSSTMKPTNTDPCTRFATM